VLGEAAVSAHFDGINVWADALAGLDLRHRQPPASRTGSGFGEVWVAPAESLCTSIFGAFVPGNTSDRQRRQRLGERGDVVGGGVRAGVPRSQ